jgi:hypothetical protein
LETRQVGSTMSGEVRVNDPGGPHGRPASLAVPPPTGWRSFDPATSGEFEVATGGRKGYGEAPTDDQRRYSPPVCLWADNMAILGKPDPVPGLQVLRGAVESHDPDPPVHPAHQRLQQEGREPALA